MGVKICPECGGKVSDTRNDCPHCNHKFIEFKNCPDCNSEIDKNSFECPICGRYFFEEDEEKKSENKKSKKKLRKPLIILISCTVVSVIALICAISFITSPLEFEKKVDGTYEVVDCNENAKNIVIPKLYRGKLVTSIGEYAFKECYNLESVSIPDSVKIIKKGAFYYCIKLEKITIPDSVTTIENNAFGWCSNLSSITMSQNLTHLGAYAFSYCEKLPRIFIPISVEYVGEYAFYESKFVTIYCEAESEPYGWSKEWNYEDQPVYWSR